MPKAIANGIELEYDTFGNAGSDPLLLIMGLGTQMTAWTPEFCEALAGHGHFVIRFDNRDIGLSTKFDGARAPGLVQFALHKALHLPLKTPYTLSDMAADAVDLLNVLGLDKAHIVGASMGGMIAQLVTVNYPERVKTLTSIMSSSGDPSLPEARPHVKRHIFFNRPASATREAMIAHLIESARLISSPGYPRSDEDWHKLISANLDRSFYPQGFTRQLAAIIADGSRVNRLAGIRHPTLVIHGKEDPLVPVECGIDTARHISASRLELIEGMAHDLPPTLVPVITSLIGTHTKTYNAQAT